MHACIRTHRPIPGYILAEVHPAPFNCMLGVGWGGQHTLVRKRICRKRVVVGIAVAVIVIAVCCRRRHRRSRLTSSLPWPRSSSSSTAIYVTVYLCRKNGLYRIKPMPGSRKLDNLTWGKTDNERLSQWKKVMGKVNEYNSLPRSTRLRQIACEG